MVFKEIGLDINMDKCMGTALPCKCIDFLGQVIASDDLCNVEPISLSD